MRFWNRQTERRKKPERKGWSFRGLPAAMTGVDLKLLTAAVLRGPFPKTEQVPLPTLYKDTPVVLYAIRRVG